MIKSLRALLFLSSLSIASYAQNFTWIRGSDTSAKVGLYGIMGVPASTNDPGCRHGSATWTDANGDLWMFGGEGYSNTATLCWLNDMWKYDRSANQWTWIRGSNGPNQTGNYGTMGVSAPTNEPGAREFMNTWTDTAGKFWMFGGDGFDATSYGRLSDLWKYDPLTNEWTWVKGSNIVDQYGIYGTLGVSAPSNLPGARMGHVTWVDAANNLWMFAGRGYPAASPFGYLNDLWRYNIANNEWTWVSGSNIAGQLGVYGTQFVPSVSNIPGAKEFSASWMDAEGKMYFFGGSGSGYYNDLWKYDPTANTWTWLSGSNTPNPTGVYGTQNVASPSTVPGGRYAASYWTDLSGNFWLFGGTGWAGTTLNRLNDLFKYNPCTNEWTWIKGSDTINSAGNYGIQGVSAPANMPGARLYNNNWRTPDGKLWLLGGSGYDATGITINNMNDLWHYNPVYDDSISATPANKICAGSQVTLTAHNTPSNNAVWYLASFPSTSISAGNNYISPPLSAANSQSVYAYLADVTCSLKQKASIQITVNPLPQIAISGTNEACFGSVVTLTASGANTYTWHTTAKTPTATFTVSGTSYNAIVLGTSTAGCENSTQKTLTVHALPNVGISATHTVICNSEINSTTLTGTGANTYTWNNSIVAPTFVASAKFAGTLVVNIEGEDINGCVASWFIALEVAICIGVDDKSFPMKKIEIFPNPSSGEFNLKRHGNLSSANIQILNSLGQKVYERNSNQAFEHFSLNLSPGFYTVLVLDKNQEQSMKLIIN